MKLLFGRSGCSGRLLVRQESLHVALGEHQTVVALEVPVSMPRVVLASELADFKERQCPGINLNKVSFDTKNHGTPGGDNWMEGTYSLPRPTHPLTDPGQSHP